MTIWKDNLGDLSREIRHLQDQSTSMGIKLNNRRSVREYLSQLVDELLIPEEMIEGRVQSLNFKHFTRVTATYPGICIAQCITKVMQHHWTPLKAICTAELNEQAFMEQLHQLNRKIRFIREQTYHDTEACKDVAQGSVQKMIKNVYSEKIWITGKNDSSKI